MPVALLVANPEGTAEIYDKVPRQLGAEQPAAPSSTSPGRALTAAFASSTSGSPRRTHPGSSTSA